MHKLRIMYTHVKFKGWTNSYGFSYKIPLVHLYVKIFLDSESQLLKILSLFNRYKNTEYIPSPIRKKFQYGVHHSKFVKIC